MTETQRQIIDYLQQQPGCQAAAIAQYLGTNRVSTSNLLINMVQKGMVRTELIKDGTPRGRRVYYPSIRLRTTNDVINTARKIGGPFGIAAAQVMS